MLTRRRINEGSSRKAGGDRSASAPPQKKPVLAKPAETRLPKQDPAMAQPVGISVPGILVMKGNTVLSPEALFATLKLALMAQMIGRIVLASAASVTLIDITRRILKVLVGHL